MGKMKNNYNHISIRTLKMKISIQEDFLPFMKAYNEIYNYCTNICFKYKILDYPKLNAKIYQKLTRKYPNIPVSIFQCICKYVIGNIKSFISNKIDNKKYPYQHKLKYNEKDYKEETLELSLKILNDFKDNKPNKKPLSAIYYNKCNISLIQNNTKISFSSLLIERKSTNKNKYLKNKTRINSRLFSNLIIPNWFNKKYPNKRFKCGGVSYDSSKNQFYAILFFEINNQKPSCSSQELKVLGIDRGINNIVYTSNNYFINSNKINKIRNKYEYNRKQIQKKISNKKSSLKGTRSLIRAQRRYKGRENRFIEDTNHIISKNIVNLPFDIFVLEDLSGIRNQKSKGKNYNKKLNSWSFNQLEQMIEYKGNEFGK